VANEVVKLSEHLKHVGSHEVVLKFAKDLKATVSVVVVAEQAEGETEEQVEE